MAIQKGVKIEFRCRATTGAVWGTWADVTQCCMPELKPLVTHLKPGALIAIKESGWIRQWRITG